MIGQGAVCNVKAHAVAGHQHPTVTTTFPVGLPLATAQRALALQISRRRRDTVKGPCSCPASPQSWHADGDGRSRGHRMRIRVVMLGAGKPWP